MSSSTRWNWLFAVIAGLTSNAITLAQDITFASNDPNPYVLQAGVTTSVNEPAIRSTDSYDLGVPDAGSKRSGLRMYAEGLYWQAHRQGLDYASFDNPVWLTPTVVESLNLPRNGGVRAGIGYGFAGCWEIGWNYTNFFSQTQGAVASSDVPGTSLFATRSYLDHSVNAVQAQANLSYNVHDIEMSRAILVADNAAIRLFGGFRWAMIDQDFQSTYQYRDLQSATVSGQIDNPMSMDGYGIRLGMEGQWLSSWGLKLFGRGAGSVLVGNFHGRMREVDQVDGTIIDYSPRYTQAVPVLDAAAGVAWCRGPWEISGGYELSTWFNMGEINRASNDLILDGLFLRLAYVR